MALRYRYRMRLPAAFLALTLVLPSDVEAQSVADTSAVLLVAWDTVVGSVPFSHPEAATSLACLASGPLGSRPHFADLSSDVRKDFVDVLAQRRSVVLTTGCVIDRTTQPTFPMRDREGRFAIEVQLTRLDFAGPDSAEVAMHVGAGGTWGRGTLCVIERAAPARWVVDGCRVTVHR